MSCVLNKVAASGNSIAGAAIGAGLGGLGGYQLGRFLKAGEAANALIAAAGALGGGTLGYRMGEEDPSGQGRPWYEWDKRNLYRLAGGLGGAGLGVLGNRALGLKNSPIGDLGAAVLMGGLGALGGDIAFDELDQGLQKKLDASKKPYNEKEYEERKKILGAKPPEEPTSKKIVDVTRSGAKAVKDAADELIPEAVAGAVDLGAEGAKAVGEAGSDALKEVGEKGLVQTVKDHPVTSTVATAAAVDAGRYSAAAYNAVKTNQLFNALKKAGRLPKDMTVDEIKAYKAFISHQIAGTRTGVGEFFNFRPARNIKDTYKLFGRPDVLDTAKKFYTGGGRAARNWSSLTLAPLRILGTILTRGKIK